MREGIATRTQAASGGTEPNIQDFGSIRIIAQVTVDGGYSINVFTGPIREDALCFTTADRDLFRRVYAIIGQGGNNGVSPAGIHAAVVGALTDDLRFAQRRRNHARIELLNWALDRFETPAEAAVVAEMVAGIRANLKSPPPARNFAELRDRFAAGFARTEAAA